MASRETETSFNFEEFFEFVVNGVHKNEKGRKSYRWKIEKKVKNTSIIQEEHNTTSEKYFEEKFEVVDSVEATATTADAMIRQLKVFKTLEVFDKVPEIKAEDILKKRLVFIYFPDCSGYTQVRSIMLLDILTKVYYAKRNNVDQAIKNNLMVIDEAHELLPKKRKSSDLSDDFFNFIEKRFTRIAKEGRKYGISLVIASQILSELNDEVKYNAQTRIFFKLSERDMKDLDLDKETIRLINGLRKGYAVVYSRDNLEIGRATEVKVLPPVFLHCDPRVADKHFESEVAQIKKERIKFEKNNKDSKNKKKNFYFYPTY
ncbi:MAG: ATP-binding protein [archaeon]|nr:ATP-binding protein [archaeon]